MDVKNNQMSVQQSTSCQFCKLLIKSQESNEDQMLISLNCKHVVHMFCLKEQVLIKNPNLDSEQFYQFVCSECNTLMAEEFLLDCFNSQEIQEIQYAANEQFILNEFLKNNNQLNEQEIKKDQQLKLLQNQQQQQQDQPRQEIQGEEAKIDNVCLNCFKNILDIESRILSCQHKFCVQCLKDYIKNKKEQSKNFLLCPQCSKLTQQFIIMDLVEKVDLELADQFEHLQMLELNVQEPENIKQQNNNDIQQELMLCLICLKEQQISGCIVLECCHYFCETCLKAKLEQNFKLKLVQNCPECQQILQPELLIQFENLFKITLQDDKQDNQQQQQQQIQYMNIDQNDKLFKQALDYCNGDKEQALLLLQQNQYEEIFEFENLEQCQKRAVKHVAKLSIKQQLRAEQDLEVRFKKFGYDKKHLQQVLIYIRDEAPIIIHFNLNKLDLYLNDTHYRNCFENRGRFYSTDARRLWEQNLFGGSYYDCTKSFLLPKYGVLNIVKDATGVKCCQGYGRSFFVLQNVRLRTTFTSKDSASNNGKINIGTCQNYAHILNEYSDKELESIIKCATREFKFGCDSSVIQLYKEAQIHGFISFKKHIQSMFYDKTEWTHTAIQLEKKLDTFRKLNKIEIIPLENIQQHIIKK